MREHIRRFVKIVADTLPVLEPIYEFGAFLVPGQETLADLRPLFPGKAYVGCDMRPGPGVDVLLDLSCRRQIRRGGHAIDLPPESVGTVLSLEVLRARL